MNAEADAYLGVVRLQQAYADICNRRAFDELGGLFLADTVVELAVAGQDPRRFVGPRETGSFIDESLKRFEFFEFVVLTSHIEVAADHSTATGRMWMNELRTDVGTGRFSMIYGLYQDGYVRRDDRWWFAHRTYATLARTGLTEGSAADGPTTVSYGLPPIR